MVKCFKTSDIVIEFHESNNQIIIITWYGALVIKLNDLKIMDVKSTNPVLKLENCVD